MKAVILAGGEGIRLRPYTTCIPKPLVPIGDEMSMIEVLIRQLKAQGFAEISLALGHMGHLIRSFVGDGSRWGMPITCWDEDVPLGTAGPLLAHLDELPSDFLVMNADVLSDLDMGAMLAQHVHHRAVLTIAAQTRTVKVDFGVLEITDGRLDRFTEKPEFQHQVSMGVYAVSRSLLSGPPRPLGFDDVVVDLLANGQPPHVHAFDGYWLDIGRPDDYDRAGRDFPELRERLFGSGRIASEPIGPEANDYTRSDDTVIDLRDTRRARVVPRNPVVTDSKRPAPARSRR